MSDEIVPKRALGTFATPLEERELGSRGLYLSAARRARSAGPAVPPRALSPSSLMIRFQAELWASVLTDIDPWDARPGLSGAYARLASLASEVPAELDIQTYLGTYTQAIPGMMTISDMARWCDEEILNRVAQYYRARAARSVAEELSELLGLEG